MQEHSIHWETDGTSRVPFAVYTDESRHKTELQRFFYKAHWNYVGLEAEIPQAGDFKRTVVGERSVIMTRGNDGQVHVVENVCATGACSFAVSVMATKKSLSALTTSGVTTSRAICRACHFGAVCARMARSTAACLPTSTRKTMASPP
jgi:nitrite reductase/ring-hydroxylating ferredoxin subunit